MLDREAIGRGRTLPLWRGQMRIKSIELPYLAVGAPAEIAVPRLAQMGIGGCLGATRAVEPGGHLIGYAFVLHETMLASRTNGLLVQTHGVDIPPLDPGHLRLNERRPVDKILGAIEGPGVVLLPVFRQPRAMIFAIFSRGRIIDCRMTKRIVEVVLRELQK